MMVLAAQYRPRPAGTAMTNQAKSAGIIHCIIWLICACCVPGAAWLRLADIRCCNHMDTKTSPTRKKFPLSPRSIHRNFVLKGMASWMNATGYNLEESSRTLSGVLPRVMRMTP